MSYTVLYLKCPICTESSHVRQWAIPCFDTPTYQRLVRKEEWINNHSHLICPKCLKRSMYGELNK